MNTDKLLTLIDQHRARQTAYQHLAARYRGVLAELARIQAEMADEMPVDPDDPIDTLIRWPLDVLVELADADAAPFGLTMAQVRRLISALRQAERLEQETIDRADIVKESLALTERLVDYARCRGELVNL